jgi:hypothetical protein
MRTTTIPATTITEDINLIEEAAGVQVRFVVGQKDTNGNWIMNLQYEQFIIKGADYEELNGPPTTWAPDKPTGTYRNSDLWHYVDLQRQANSQKTS